MRFKLQLLAMSALAGLTLQANAARAQTETAVEEIIVTAEKRSQSIQDVPSAITAFTGAMRDRLGVNSVQDLTNFTPGLTTTTAATTA